MNEPSPHTSNLKPLTSARVALITGGSRGIGYGIALALAKQGFNLAINGVRPLSAETVQSSVDELKKFGVDVIYCQADIGSPEARFRMLEEIEKHYGRFHIS